MIQYLQITSIQLEIINGKMLGDATINKNKNDNRNCHIYWRHSIKQKEFVEWTCNQLKPFTNECKIVKVPARIRNKDGSISNDAERKLEHIQCFSKSLPIFTAIEKEWYLRNNEGKYIFDDKGWRIKIIPQNLKLTPLTLAVWYLDDGSLGGGRRKYAQIFSLGFSYDENIFLRDQVRNLGFNDCHVKSRKFNDKEKFCIFIGEDSYYDFISMIDKYNIFNELKYKTDLSKYKISWMKSKSGLHPYNTSGMNNLSFDKRDKKWMSGINCPLSGRISLGYYNNRKDAERIIKISSRFKKFGILDADFYKRLRNKYIQKIRNS